MNTSMTPVKGKRHVFRFRLLVLTSVLFLGAAISTSPATATQPEQPFVTPIGTDQPASSQHISAFSDELTNAAGDVVPLVADTIYSLGIDDSVDSRGISHGFAGQILDVPNRSITLHWKGDLPDDVNTYFSTAAALYDVNVQVVDGAIFTRTEEQAAGERITAREHTLKAGISSVSANADGTGITIRMIEGEPPERVKDQIAQIASIDSGSISYETHVGEIVPAASRNNDAAPWKGGGRTNAEGVRCSTGFAALSGPYGVLLSANHCYPDPTSNIKDGGGTTITTATHVARKPAIDSLAIDPTASPATVGKIFRGAWNSTTQTRVTGWASNWTGDSVCAGGATTGTHCGTITHDAVCIPGLSGCWYIEARSSGAFLGSGDSGGPVYRHAGSTAVVTARGIVKGGTSTTTCGSHNPDTNPTCYRNLYYVPISVVLNTWNFSLETG